MQKRGDGKWNDSEKQKIAYNRENGDVDLEGISIGTCKPPVGACRSIFVAPDTDMEKASR